MKYITLIFLLFASIGFSQDSQLSNYEWRLESLIIQGSDYPVPSNTEVEHITLTFQNQNLNVQVCNTGYGSVTYSGTDSFTITDMAITLLLCNTPDNSFFENVYFPSFFTQDGPDDETYQYTIIDGEDGMVLTVTSPENNVAIYNGQSLGMSDDKLPEINIYPNPASNFVFVYIDNATELANYDIYDQLGRKCLSKEMTEGTMDISGLSPGLYILTVNDGSRSISGKIIKQ